MSEPTLAAGPAANSGAEAPTTGPTEANNGSGTSQPVGDTSTGESGGTNPAWSKMLEKLPTEFHKLIEPDLREWDSNFQTKTQQVQSQYEPYKFLLDDGVPPEAVQSGLQLMAMIEADPRAFHQQMAEFYKDQWGQGPEVSQDNSNSKPDEATFSLDGEEDFDITQHPKFKELAEQQETLATYLAQQIEKEQQDKAAKELETEEARLKETYGEYDEEFVYSYAMQNEVPLEDAVKKFVQLRDKFQSAPRASDSAPAVFSPSGGVPSSNPRPGSLSDKETRALVAEMAARAASQGN